MARVFYGSALDERSLRANGILSRLTKACSRLNSYMNVDTATALIFDTHWPLFEKDVVEASHAQPMLVDFWADWCPPCSTLTPILERLTPSYGGRIRLAKIEVDAGDNMKLAGRYAMRGFPTVLLFVKGEMVARFHSAKSEPWVRAFITEFTGIE